VTGNLYYLEEVQLIVKSHMREYNAGYRMREQGCSPRSLMPGACTRCFRQKGDV
jgi:hypothetical protein